MQFVEGVMQRGETIALNCQDDIPARVVIIQITTSAQEILTLCEVEIYGSK